MPRFDHNSRIDASGHGHDSASQLTGSRSFDLLRLAIEDRVQRSNAEWKRVSG